MNESVMKSFTNFFNVPPTDRTGLLKGIIPVDLDHQVPILGYLDVSDNIADIIDDRALCIQKTFPDKDIHVLWSGGIDSTTVVYSMLKNCIPFTVVTDENSKLEYPKLYEELRDVYHVDFVHCGDIEEINKETSILITGEIGDQISGSMLMLNYNDEQRKKDPRYIVPLDIYNNFRAPIEDRLGVYGELNTSEYLWALNFFYKYTNVVERMTQVSEFDGVNLIHFFNTEEFQIWAMENYKSFCNFDTIFQYKNHLKKYIYDINCDEDYFLFKVKVPSLKSSTFYRRHKVERS